MEEVKPLPCRSDKNLINQRHIASAARLPGKIRRARPYLSPNISRNSYFVCRRIRSATIAINSEFVGLPLPVSIV